METLNAPVDVSTPAATPDAAPNAAIEQRLREIVVRALRLNKQPDEIAGLDLVAELGVTSIDALEILINVEMEFGIEVADSDLSQGLVASVAQLADYIAQRLPGAHPAP